MAWREGTGIEEALDLGPRVAEWLSPAREVFTGITGVATLALLASRWEYWEVYCLAAGYATSDGGQSGDVIEHLAQGASMAGLDNASLLAALTSVAEATSASWPRAQSFVQWCTSQPLGRVLSSPRALFVAAVDINLAVRPAAFASADISWGALARCDQEFPDGGPAFQRCVEQHD